MTEAAGQRRMLTLLTPEDLPLELEIAPAGSRMAAFALDFLIMAGLTVGVALLVYLASSGGGFEEASPFLALFLIASFLIWNGYFLYFELRWGGSTPGKRWVGLRVISRNGGPLTTGAVFARNLMRELEFYLPLQALIAPQLLVGNAPGWAALLALLWLFVFLFMPLFNRDRARCGDLVAGTLVVVRPLAVLLPDPADTENRRQQERKFTFSDEQLDMYGIKELQVLEQLLRESSGDPLKQDVLQEVCDRICRKIAWTTPVARGEVVAFLQEFYLAQRRRLEHRLLLGERREHKREGRLRGPPPDGGLTPDGQGR